MTIYSIYKATNTITGKSYIGFDSHWSTRKSAHKTASNGDSGYNKFYNAIKKYGWEAFTWEVIYQSTDGKHCLNTMECYFITEYNSLSEGYNSTSGGEGALGSLWWNNGTVQVFTRYPPDNTFIRGRLPFNNKGSKKGSDIQRGKIWITDGISEMMVSPTDLIPEKYFYGRITSPKKYKRNVTALESKWWNNGTEEKMSKYQPEGNFTLGRLVPNNTLKKEILYYQSPKKCVVCLNNISYERRHLSTCSSECSTTLRKTIVSRPRTR